MATFYILLLYRRTLTIIAVFLILNIIHNLLKLKEVLIIEIHT